MSILSREGILAKRERRYRDIVLPSGGQVRIQSLTELERSEYNMMLLDKKGNLDRKMLNKANRLLVVKTLVDENNSRIFMDHEEELLADMDSMDMEAIADASREHIGFGKEEVEDSEKKE